MCSLSNVIILLFIIFPVVLNASPTCFFTNWIHSNIKMLSSLKLRLLVFFFFFLPFLLPFFWDSYFILYSFSFFPPWLFPSVARLWPVIFFDYNPLSPLCNVNHFFGNFGISASQPLMYDAVLSFNFFLLASE